MYDLIARRLWDRLWAVECALCIRYALWHIVLRIEQALDVGNGYIRL